MLLEGLFLPLTTPFYGDGRLYLRKLEHNVERYSRTPAAGLALLTPTGEGDLLSDAERLEVLRVAAATAAPEKVLLADCTRPSVVSTLELLGAADALRFDAALVRAPRGLGRGEAGRRTYLETIADRTPLPVILAEDSGADATGDDGPEGALGVEAVSELARSASVLGWVAGDATRIDEVLARTAAIGREVSVTPVFAAVTRRMLTPQTGGGGSYIAAASLGSGGTALTTEAPAPALRTRSRRVGFQVLAGRTSTVLEALGAGARGALLPFAVCTPQASYEVLAAWKDGDAELAGEKARRLHEAAIRLEEQMGVPGMKVGCDLNGYFGGRSRLPLLPLRGAEQAEAERLLRGMRS